METLEKIVKDLQKVDDDCYAKNQARKGTTDLYAVRRLPLKPDEIPWQDVKDNPIHPNTNKASAAFVLKEDLMCIDCLSSLWSCKHNPNRGKSAEEWQAHYEEQAKLKEVVNTDGTVKQVRKRGPRVKHVVISNDMKDDFISAYRAGETIQVISKRFKALPAEISMVLKNAGMEIRRGRGASKIAKPKKEIDQALVKKLSTEYLGGKTITMLAKQYEIIPLAVSQALRSAGVAIRPKGRPPGSGMPINRKKKIVIEITPATIKEAKTLYKSLGGVVKVAKKLNVNPALLSAALKKEGIKIQRGRRAK